MSSCGGLLSVVVRVVCTDMVVCAGLWWCVLAGGGVCWPVVMCAGLWWCVVGGLCLSVTPCDVFYQA